MEATNQAAASGNDSDGETRPKIKYEVEHIYPDSRPLGVPVIRPDGAQDSDEEEEKSGV